MNETVIFHHLGGQSVAFSLEHERRRFLVYLTPVRPQDRPL